MTEARENVEELLESLAQLEELAALDAELGDASEESAEAGSLRERTRFAWSSVAAHDPGLEVPSDRLRRRFFAELETRRERQTPAPSRSSLGLAAATLLVGLGVGWLLPSRTVAPQSDERVVRLEQEVAQMGQLLTLSLLDHSSANERLRGVALSEQTLTSTEAASDEVVSALLETVRVDESENVRLAALDALAILLERPQVRSGLAEALPLQQSPMLQVALSDVLSDGFAASERAAFEQLLERPDLDPVVRERLQSILGGGEL
ncbi:MAG: hypothetical protein AAGA81_08700 [Acidobacteriota bacterium]